MGERLTKEKQETAEARLREAMREAVNKLAASYCATVAAQEAAAMLGRDESQVLDTIREQALEQAIRELGL